MRARTVAFAAFVLTLVFLSGFGANEIIRPRRVVIGDNQVVLGQDAFGGYLVIRDILGNEMFRVQGGEVRMPDGNGQSSAMSSASFDDSADDKIAQLQDVRPFVVNPAIQDEIRELTAAADDFEDKARQMEQQAGELRDKETRTKTIHYWNSRGERSVYRMTDSISNRALRGELRDHALAMKKIARAKRGEAKRHERAIAVARQVVTAWNGNRQIILITKSDMGNEISKIPANGFFAWTGTAARPDDIDVFDKRLEHYEVRAIKPAGRPEGWREAP